MPWKPGLAHRHRIRYPAGGFSPGVAARLRLADGRRVFLKAISMPPKTRLPREHRREGGSPRPSGVRADPALAVSYDEGDWVAIV